MNAKDILSKNFEKTTIRGYKPDEVDDFLREISDEFAALQKQNAEQKEKMEALAEAILKYQADEDALKDAFLNAQKQGNAIVADAKATAEKHTKETNEAIEKKLNEAKMKSERLVNDADEYSKKTRKEADDTAAKIVSDANAKAAEIKAAMDRQQEIQENILQETRKEVLEYRQKILDGYKEHIAFIESLPEKCENDFVKRTAEEAEKREAERKKQQAQQAQQQQAKLKFAAQQKEKEARRAAEKAAAESKTAQQKSSDEKSRKDDKSAESESNMPFFDASSEKVTHHNNLDFGKNKSNK